MILKLSVVEHMNVVYQKKYVTTFFLVLDHMTSHDHDSNSSDLFIISFQVKCIDYFILFVCLHDANIMYNYKIIVKRVYVS